MNVDEHKFKTENNHRANCEVDINQSEREMASARVFLMGGPAVIVVSTRETRPRGNSLARLRTFQSLERLNLSIACRDRKLACE